MFALQRRIALELGLQRPWAIPSMELIGYLDREVSALSERERI